MKFSSLLILISAIVFSCRPARKVQKIDTAISKIDTTTSIVVNDKAAVDSFAGIREVYGKVLAKRIEFKTFSAKVRVGYEGKDGGDEATAFIRLEKDKAMWLSLRGALGIEGFRVLVTKDSVKVMNLLKKQVQFRSIDYLKEITQLPFDFSTLQDLVVGNPVYLDSNIISYKANANNELLILMAGKLFKHLLTLDNQDFKVLHSKLDDVDAVRNRTCDITFGSYASGGGRQFSTRRKISVAEKSKLDIDLEFKQYSFDEPLTFPFNIPKNYKVK
ncbi:DUF4292 domain-containing protein [Segetibacter sp. 3557_3]|uniref:DUF4292 domain-containing protein n=1 Tax=Segetibacter sp. 3557_3 TaxID=2547429 RepID=UPI0010588D94|nr:DUF4292 domain-containing protein [Segetibacter sp. 3557_3]TDH26556.1 DUF4292 domain-containing protein [Segetibacter sp. 3557_3]